MADRGIFIWNEMRPEVLHYRSVRIAYSVSLTQYAIELS
jgi:hypothetical protein